MSWRALRGRVLALSVSLGGTVATGDVAADDLEPRARLRLSRDNDVTRVFKLLGRNAVWREVGRVSLSWQTFHTQGLAKVGEVFFVSAVEVLGPRVSTGISTDALYDFSLDRSAGAGKGWLFKFDAAGTLLGKVELTQGDAYHPGGIDFDGHHLWVPVAEYRPNSHSNVYRVDPETLAAEHVFSETDHIGGIVHNRHGGTLHGVSWGSRRLYTWSLDRDSPDRDSPEQDCLDEVCRQPTSRDKEGRGSSLRVASSRWAANPQFYIDYQDCHYQGTHYMLCGGVAGYSTPLGSVAFGGLDLVDLRQNRPIHQIPVNAFVDEGLGQNPGLSLAHNAFWAEATGNGSLRVHFMTESDNLADLLVYEVMPWIDR